MKLKALFAAAIIAFGSLTVFEVGAGPISGLFNTGSGIGAGTQDTNYALSYTGADANAVAAAATGFGFEGTNIHSAWLANTAAAQWLTPLSAAQTSFDASSNGIYTWSLTFDLTGFDASSASFSGQWATDNSGVMKLNGTQLLNNSGGFGGWSTFSDAGGTFNAGLNTIDFIVTNFQQNGGNPTGLIVDFQNSHVNVRTSVPEPTTLALLSLGLFGLGFNRRKRLQ